MKKKSLAVLLLAIVMLTLCGCESDLERAQRELDEATRTADEAYQRMVDAYEYIGEPPPFRRNR